MDKYIIEKSELEELLKIRNLYNALQMGGVDNWEWYGETIDQFESQYGDIDNVEEQLNNFEKFANY